MRTYLFGKRTGATHTTGHKDVQLSYDLDDADYANEALTQNADLVVGYYSTIPPPYVYLDAALIRFDLSAISADESILSATLQVVFSGGNLIPAPGINVGVFGMTTAWGVDSTDEGVDEDPGASGQATWNSAFALTPIPVSWPGITFDGLPQPYDVLFSAGPINLLPEHVRGQTYDVDITTMVQAWLASEPFNIVNHGIALVQQTPYDNFDTWAGFGSQDSGVVSERWLLTVITDGDAPSSGASAVRKAMKHRRYRI